HEWLTSDGATTLRWRSRSNRAVAAKNERVCPRAGTPSSWGNAREVYITQTRGGCGRELVIQHHSHTHRLKRVTSQEERASRVRGQCQSCVAIAVGEHCHAR